MIDARLQRAPRQSCGLARTWLAAWLLVAVGTAIAADGEDGLRVAVISDLNGAYGSDSHNPFVHDAVRRIIDLRPDLVISTGDMVAGQAPNGLSPDELSRMWRGFHAAVTRPLEAAGIPFAITPGNHDASAYAGFRVDREIFENEWRDPPAGVALVDSDGFPFNYAFALGDVLFVSLDVTTAGSLPAHNIEWLERLLDEHRDRFRHRVVYSHVPVWNVVEKRGNEASADQRLHRVLLDAGVRIYLSGHDHAFYPGTLDGITYISQPCLGSGARRLMGAAGGRSRQGFTVMDFDGQTVRVAVLTAPDFDQPLNWAQLPESIPTPAGPLARADLADSSVVAASRLAQAKNP